MKHIFLLLIMTSLLAACVPNKVEPEPMPIVSPPPQVMEPPSENPGSLFDPGQASLLYEDNRARRIGDIVTIMVDENSSGNHKADTKSEKKESSFEATVPQFFGSEYVSAIPLIGGVLSGETGTTPIVSGNSKGKLDSKGETKRQSTMSATVGCRVVRVLPGGVLQVEGARELRINEETQILVVAGLVRPQDIDADNMVSSNHLANAKIGYYGRGVLADKQKPGWMTRILDNMYLF